MEAIRARCEELGWAATTGPWDWYEPDFRVQTTIDGVTLAVIAMVPYEIDDEGWIAAITVGSQPRPPHLVQQFLDVTKAVLKDGFDVTDVEDHEKNPFPRPRKGLPG